MDWKKVKCNKCQEFKKCKKDNTSKGSPACQRRLKLIPLKEEEDTISSDAASTAMFWSLMQKNQKVKSDEEKE